MYAITEHTRESVKNSSIYNQDKSSDTIYSTFDGIKKTHTRTHAQRRKREKQQAPAERREKSIFFSLRFLAIWWSISDFNFFDLIVVRGERTLGNFFFSVFVLSLTLLWFSAI